VQTFGNGSVTIEDSELYGFSDAAIGFDNWKGYRLNIHGVLADGVKFGSNVTLADSWVHDFNVASGNHADGGQMQYGVSNLVISHNTIDLGSSADANSALFLAPDQGPSTNGPVLVDGNYLNGGNYTLFCVDGNNGQYIVKNITISNNQFGPASQYGPDRVNVPVTWTGNTNASGAALLR
jgi:hypothetical protein